MVFLFFQGEIRATGFNDAVDKFYELLEVNKVCINIYFPLSGQKNWPGHLLEAKIISPN